MTSREHNSIWTESKMLNKHNIPGVSYPVLKQAVSFLLNSNVASFPPLTTYIVNLLVTRTMSFT